MTTNEDILWAYNQTTASQRISLDDGLKNTTGEKTGLLYELIEKLNYYGFSTHLISSDGGIKEFEILYKFGEYSIIVERVYWQEVNNLPDTLDKLRKWLNIHIRNIETTAVLLSNNIEI